MPAETDTRDDAALVLAAVDGDQQAFADLYQRYVGPVYDFLARMLRDRTEAEDVAQETFVRAMQSLGGLQQGTNFRGWIFTIARNTALNRIEQRKRLRPLALSGSGDDGDEYELDIVDTNRFSDPAEAAGSAAVAALVWEAAAGLEPKQYALLDLHLRQGLDSAEIAGVLGVTKNNAYVMINRMKKAVEETIGAYVMLRAGRQSCPRLDAELRQMDKVPARISPQTRRLVDRHVAGCATCQRTKGNLVSPLSILGALAPVPLTPDAQARIFGEVMREWPVAGSPPASPGARRPAQNPSRLATLTRERPALISVILAVAGLALLLALVPGSPLANRLFAEDDERATVVVRLADSDGAPLSGVTIALSSVDGTQPLQDGTTDANGLLRWSDLPSGEYRIAVDGLPDGLTVSGDRLTRAISLDPGETLDLSGAFQIVTNP